MFADVDAGNVGADRPKVAADFLRSAGLEIEGVEMARPAVGPEEDHREIAIDSAALLRRQDVSQARRRAAAQRAQAEAADFQPGAAVERTGTIERRILGRHACVASSVRSAGLVTL